ncbi:MAG: valine--tRNA ligase [Candidatus Micrarchaeaceae archaeon]
MDDKYIAKEVEQKIRKYWEDNKIYEFKNNGKAIFAIDTPPPTVSGFLHVGHVYSYSQADFVARYKRMNGYDVFYPFGLDNNGLPTEILVEKKNNVTSENVGREKFIELVESSIKEYENLYIDIWKTVGVSVDWTKLYTTISKDVQSISQYSFIELYKMGRAYRKETPTIWCTKCKTALSQMELEDKLLKSKFVKIKFAEDIIIATTRPELLPACVIIFVNPEDKKNSNLIGRKVKVPIFGQEVEIKSDKRVNPDKGTGVVMSCTFGDLTDIDWYKAYNLPLKIVIDEKANMLHPHFKGMKVHDARKAIIDELKQKNFIVEEKEIEHIVNVHERCKTEIEFLVKKQWYIRYLDLKEKLIELGNQLNWKPEYMKIRYENWVNGLQWDWSISRQRYYGIPFPVWYCKKCNEPILPNKEDLPINPLKNKPKTNCQKCGSAEIIPEEDVLDTWATSSLTPLINKKWSLKNEIKYDIYPMSLRPQGHDIISFWLFTTIVKCYLHTGKLPWKDVMISGHGLDSKGKPMHKSVGNIVEPMPIIEKYGADSLRYWTSSARLGEEALFQEKDLITGSRIVNKLWNVAKFTSKIKNESSDISNLLDRWILSKLMVTIKKVNELFEQYNYSGAKREIEAFFWEFTDNYMEYIKHRVYNNIDSPGATLNKIFLSIIKLFAPFMPYVTEEIYQNLYKENENKNSIHLNQWPVFEEKLFNKKILEEGENISKLIKYIRAWKHDNKLALNSNIKELIINIEINKNYLEDIKGIMKIDEIKIGEGKLEVPETQFKIDIINS